MARSKPTSSRAPPPRAFAPLRPYVRSSLPLRASYTQAPASMQSTLDIITLQQHNQSTHNHGEKNRAHLSDHSTGSEPTTKSTIESSTSSDILSGKRRLSIIFTPTSSDVSESEYGASSSIASTQMVGYTRSSVKRRCTSVSDHVRPTIRETLIGQGQWMHSPLDTIQEVEIVSNRLSAEPVVPDSQSPWSAFKNQGGRKGPLQKEQAEHAGAMRQKGACLRCRILRERCDEGDPCNQCRKRFRNWPEILGCTRDGLEDRYTTFFPEVLAANLRWDNVGTFLDTSASHWRGEPFHLPLTQFLVERKLYILVREVDVLNEKLIHRPAFAAITGCINKAINLHSPPLLPYYKGRDSECERTVSETLSGWLQGVTEGSEWHWHCFGAEVDDLWERNILKAICNYHLPADAEHEGLATALRLTFLNHMLIHPFAVPNEDVEGLFKRLHHPAYKNLRTAVTEVSPRGVNKYLAMLVFANFKTVATKALKILSDRLIARNNSMVTRELAFCEAFLCLTVLGQTQVSVLNQARMEDIEGDHVLTRDMAIQQIRYMEEKMAQPIIELCINKFRKPAKSESGASPLTIASSNFFNRLRTITAECGEDFSSQTELGNIDNDNFSSTNTRRLLRKLYSALSGYFGELGHSDLQELD